MYQIRQTRRRDSYVTMTPITQQPISPRRLPSPVIYRVVMWSTTTLENWDWHQTLDILEKPISISVKLRSTVKLKAYIFHRIWKYDNMLEFMNWQNSLWMTKRNSTFKKGCLIYSDRITNILYTNILYTNILWSWSWHG